MSSGSRGPTPQRACSGFPVAVVGTWAAFEPQVLLPVRASGGVWDCETIGPSWWSYQDGKRQFLNSGESHATLGSVVDLDAVVDELYGLPREQFTAVRNDRAAEAKKAGDRELASAIQQLRRPTVSAWLANLLARRRPDEVAKLLELGTVLRSAQDELEADKLRQLSPQRRRIVTALRQQAEELADESGQAVSEAVGRELEDTLEAALVDHHAGRSLQEGRLTSPLHYAGLGDTFAGADTAVAGKTDDVAESKSAAPPSAVRTRGRSTKRADDQDARRAQERLRQAEAEVRQAQRQVREARRHYDIECAKAERARRRLEEHDSRRHTLEEQVADAEREATDREAEHEQQEQNLAAAETEREAALREAERAGR